MRLLARMLLSCLLLTGAVAVAQGNPYTNHIKTINTGIQGILLRSAEKMPEENYSFKPLDTVRSFGQILGHAADSQYYFCSMVLGEKNPAPNVEKTKTSKAELVTALKESFRYCDKAYDSMTDASGRELVKLFGTEPDTPKLGVLDVNNLHLVEHYGNLVAYMRMKNIVPPTSEPKPTPPPSAPQQKK